MEMFFCFALCFVFNESDVSICKKNSPHALPTQEGLLYFNKESGLEVHSKRMDVTSMFSPESKLCGPDIFEAIGDGLAQKFTDLSLSSVDCLFTRFVQIFSLQRI